ncbi:MAG: hypothetical protein R2698_02035 [Microthrixaceae bacterium]
MSTGRNSPAATRAAGTTLGVGLVVAAVAAAVRRKGRQVRNRADSVLDGLGRRPHTVAERTVPTHDGGELFCVESGSGPAVLLMHGVTLQWWVWRSDPAAA